MTTHMQTQPSSIPQEVLAVLENLRGKADSTTTDQQKNDICNVLEDVRKKTQGLFDDVQSLAGSAASAVSFCRGAFTDAADDLVDTIEDVSIKVPALGLAVKMFQQTLKGCVEACLDAPASGKVVAARAG